MAGHEAEERDKAPRAAGAGHDATEGTSAERGLSELRSDALPAVQGRRSREGGV